MNHNSKLCCFIARNPDNWQTILTEEYGIKVKQEENYAIFNYGFACDYSNPLVQEARGIIIDTESLQVVCWPFRKFGNYTESYADSIDWNTAKVQEKVDGSIVKLWFDHRLGKWQFSTNGVIRAEKAPLESVRASNYLSLIQKAKNFADIPFQTLDRDYTYIFELVSPDNQVVVPYDATMLYHTGTRSNVTGEETDMDIGVRKPAAYPIQSLNECIEAAIKLNKFTDDGITAEGYVVVDSHWNRIKVKSPDYIVQHHLTQMKSISKQECLQLLLSECRDIDIICQANPGLIPVFKYYDYQLARLCSLADRLVFLSRKLYEEYSFDRGAVARILTRHPLGSIGLRSLDSAEPGNRQLRKMPLGRLCKLIPDYEEEDLSKLFMEEKE